MLDEEAVLDALGASSRVPLTTKRTVACVNRATSRVVGGHHLRSNDLWVHEEDCTVSNATMLTRLAERNRELRIHVYGGDSAEPDYPEAPPLVGYLGAVYAFGIDESPIVYTSGEDGPGLNPVVAYFLGHLLASLPKDDVSIRAMNGRQFNLSELINAPHLHRHLIHTRHTSPQRLQHADWCYLDGALYHNALRTACPIFPPTGHGDRRVKFMYFRRMRLTDDSMLHIGAKLRTHSVSKNVEGMCFCYNHFGELGTAAIFGACRPSVCSLQVHPFKYEALTSLRFEHTPMGKHGVPHLVNAIAKGCIPKLANLGLVSVGMVDGSALQLFALLGTSLVCNLETLSVSLNPFSGFAFTPLTMDAWMCPKLVTLRLLGLPNVGAKDYAVLARAIVDGRLQKLHGCLVPSTGAHCVQVALSAHKMMSDAKRLIAEAEAPPPPPPKSKARKMRKTATSASASMNSHSNNPPDASDSSSSSEESGSEAEASEDSGESEDPGESGESGESGEF